MRPLLWVLVRTFGGFWYVVDMDDTSRSVNFIVLSYAFGLDLTVCQNKDIHQPAPLYNGCALRLRP